MTSLEKARPIHVRYFNGLERTQVGLPEVLILGSFWTRGVRAKHARVSWHDGPTFPQLLRHETEQVEQGLRKHGRMVLIGASAGASLAANVFHEVRKHNPEADLYALLLSGWLRVGYDQSKLEHAALVRPRRGPSQAFRDSVIYCDETTLPGLTDEDKQRMKIVIPNADQIVPIDRMLINDVAVEQVSGDRHVSGIIHGLWRAPGIVDDIYQQNSSR